MKEIIGSIIDHWKKLAHRIGEFQNRFILSVFYFVIFAPFAVGVKILSDPLEIKNHRGWLARSELGDASLSARRQY